MMWYVLGLILGLACYFAGRRVALNDPIFVAAKEWREARVQMDLVLPDPDDAEYPADELDAAHDVLWNAEDRLEDAITARFGKSPNEKT